MPLRPLSRAHLAALHELAVLADAEGFRFGRRLWDDLTLDRVQVDAPCEFFVGNVDDHELLAVGGVTLDPHLNDSRVGRLRHVYVKPAVRNAGIGGALVRTVGGPRCASNRSRENFSSRACAG